MIITAERLSATAIGCHIFEADLINRFIALRIHLRKKVPAST